MRGRRRSLVIGLMVFAMAVASCATTPSASPSVVRPSSPAVVTIVQPTASETVSGSIVHVVLSLTGGKIVSQTSTNIRPDEGHVHLYVDNVLKSMNYGLEQDLQLPPGTYVLSAEFVAADHAPFNPRVVSAQTVFSVK
jgi:methionine-rich copper-binding protein CopC